jgi:hypothetical protein
VLQSPAGKASDRRKFPRRKVKIGCRWFLPDSPERKDAVIADISGGGIALVFNGPVPDEVMIETAVLKKPMKMKLKRCGEPRMISRPDGVVGLQYGLRITAMAQAEWEHLRRVAVDKEATAVAPAAAPASAVAAEKKTAVAVETPEQKEDRRIKDMIPVAVQQQMVLKLALLKRLDRAGLDQISLITMSCSGKWMSDVTLDVKSRVTKGKQEFRSVFTYNVDTGELAFVR